MKKALLLALALALAGCGFKMRGSAAVPFDTVYIPNATAGIQLDLKRYIQTGTNARVVDSPKEAEAIVQFTQESRTKEIVSLTTGGRVREYQLQYRVGFRVHDAKGRLYVQPTTIQLARDVTFNDEQVLAKESEEQLLFRDMQNDMVQQIMRRLAAAQAPR